MRKLILSMTLIGLLALGALLQPGHAEAGKRWARASVLYFTDDQVCRDGMVVTVAYLNPPDTLTTTVIAVGARLYTNTALPLPPSEVFPRPVSFYGPLLVSTTPITATRQATPLAADTDGNGSNDQTFTLYQTGAVVPWTQVVPVSSTVLIFGGNGTLAIPVADCFVNRPTVAAGTSIIIGPDRLKLPDSFSDPAAAVYRIDALPAKGSLLLSGVALAAGGTFTQADVNAGRVSYANGGSGASDSFSYSLAATSRVSVSSGGTQAAIGTVSRNAAISYDGSTLAFESDAANLVAGDTNIASDIFHHSQATRQTLRASVRFNGSQGANGAAATNASLSPDGAIVAYQSDANSLTAGSGTCEDGPDTNTAGVGKNGTDIFRSSLSGGAFTNTQRLSISSQRFGGCDGADSDSTQPSLDSAGRVAFASRATNLLNKDGGSDTNQDQDIYYRTPSSGGSTDRLSISSGFSGSQVDLAGADTSGIANPALAADGGWVAFDSTATALVSGDSNSFRDVFVRGIDSPYPTLRVSLTSAGQQATGGAGGGSSRPAIAADGRYIAFQSTNTNLDATVSDNNNVSDIFVRDRDSDGDGIFDEAGAVKTSQVSLNAQGLPGTASAQNAAISASGRYVAFDSSASNLVPNDTNSAGDVFVRDLLTNTISRVSRSAAGAEGNASSQRPAISADGSYVAFDSSASNLVPNDTNSAGDVFVYYSGFTSTFPITISGGTPEPGAGSLRYIPIILR